MEGTCKIYPGGSIFEIGCRGGFASANLKRLFANPELENLFEKRGGGDKAYVMDKKTGSLYIGGLAKPNVNGIYDPTWQICLDKVLQGEKVEYSDEETDPLFWTEAKGSIRNLCRGWSNWYCHWYPWPWYSR